MTIQQRLKEKSDSFVGRLGKIDSLVVKWGLVVFILWALFLSFEYYAFGPNSYVVLHDNADVTLAIKLARANEGTWITDGLWDTHQLGGTDVLTEVGAFDFSNVLFHIFPGWHMPRLCSCSAWSPAISLLLC